MRQVVNPILKQKGTGKALFASVAKVKNIIGYQQEINISVKLVNSEQLYVVGHCYINPNYPTTIGILE